jgi:hypothetical protein
VNAAAVITVVRTSRYSCLYIRRNVHKVVCSTSADFFRWEALKGRLSSYVSDVTTLIHIPNKRASFFVEAP